MRPLLHEIRHNPLLWPLVFVPGVLVVEKLRPEAHTLLFVLSVLAIPCRRASRACIHRNALVSPVAWIVTHNPIRKKPMRSFESIGAVR